MCVGDVLRACKNGGPYVLDDTMTHNGRPTGRIKGELHLWHPTLGVEYAGDYQVSPVCATITYSSERNIV